MKFKAISLAIALNLVSVASTLVLLPQAKSQPRGQTCESALVNARERITEGRNITIVESDIVDNSTNYPDHPKGRPLSVQIILDGNAANSVMLSPVFQKAITSEIIESCGSVGAVTFGRYQSGWGSTMGLMPDGSIQGFQCLDFGSVENTLPWGQEFCD